MGPIRKPKRRCKAKLGKERSETGGIIIARMMMISSSMLHQVLNQRTRDH